MKKIQSKYIVAVLFLNILICVTLYYAKAENVVTVWDITKTITTEIKDELIVALFIEDIKETIDNFYNNYFSIELEVFNYEIKVVGVEKSNNLIYTTFGVTPQIGAHNPVGYDEITYSVDVFGEKTLVQSKHLKTYNNIPEQYKEFIIKPLP